MSTCWWRFLLTHLLRSGGQWTSLAYHWVFKFLTNLRSPCQLEFRNCGTSSFWEFRLRFAVQIISNNLANCCAVRFIFYPKFTYYTPSFGVHCIAIKVAPCYSWVLAGVPSDSKIVVATTRSRTSPGFLLYWRWMVETLPMSSSNTYQKSESHVEALAKIFEKFRADNHTFLNLTAPRDFITQVVYHLSHSFHVHALILYLNLPLLLVVLNWKLFTQQVVTHYIIHQQGQIYSTLRTQQRATTNSTSNALNLSSGYNICV
jgi:hypothetical protein